MAVQTNPVHQRMEYLADLWNDLPRHRYNIIRTLIPTKDESMLDAFYWYMLAIDAPFNDMAILFESEFIDRDVFSHALVTELENVINLWNGTDFSGEEIKHTIIPWKPDYTIKSKNPAALFVENMNSLVESFELHPQRLVVANLFMPIGDTGVEKEMVQWLNQLAVCDFHPQFKVIITDKKEKLLSQKTADKFPDKIYTWEPDIDTGSVITQVAAMGDPAAPDTGYRLAFVKMMKAISEGKYRQTCKEGKNCLSIAEEQVETNPSWMSQIVMLHVLLSNEHFKNDKREEAFQEADKAILMGSLVPEILGKQLGAAVLAQAFIHKGILFCQLKKWKDASPLYQMAADNFTTSNMWVPAMESYRMAGLCAWKNGREDIALENTVKGYRLSGYMDEKTLQNSSFHLLLILILKLDYEDEISKQELNEKATALYGEDWRDYLNKYKTSPDTENLYEDNPFLITEDQP